jgi:hypothetical protein
MVRSRFAACLGPLSEAGFTGLGDLQVMSESPYYATTPVRHKLRRAKLIDTDFKISRIRSNPERVEFE